jgi:hypothetical protein
MFKLEGVYQGARAALIGAGPSLDMVDIPDDYDVYIGMNEAVLAYPNLDFLTCFDQKAAWKTWHAWPSDMIVVVTNPSLDKHQPGDNHLIFWDRTLSPARAGSLGEALSFCEFLGAENLDLYGVDLCWVGRKGKYSKKIEENIRESQRGGFSFHRVPIPGNEKISTHDEFELWTDGAFEKFGQQISAHADHWSMKITNCSPISQLDCFPRKSDAQP